MQQQLFPDKFEYHANTDSITMEKLFLYRALNSFKNADFSRSHSSGFRKKEWSSINELSSFGWQGLADVWIDNTCSGIIKPINNDEQPPRKIRVAEGYTSYISVHARYPHRATLPPVLFNTSRYIYTTITISPPWLDSFLFENITMIYVNARLLHLYGVLVIDGRPGVYRIRVA